MSITCTVTPGHTYGANHAVDYGDLNKLGTPGVSVPDGGTLAFGAGTALLPSISISGDPDTGFYQPTVDQLAFTTGGTARLVFSADGLTGNVRAPAGTSGAPSLAFSTDTDTGFYLAAANTTGVAGGLALADGTAATPALAFAADTDTGLAHPATDTMVLTCGGTAVATISATGIDAVGLRINGVPVATTSVDTGFARIFCDFLSDPTADGWTIAATGNATVYSRGCHFDGLNWAADGYGVLTFHLQTAGDTAAATFANWTTGWGTYSTNLIGASGLTNFTRAGEWIEFGFKFISALGNPANCSKTTLGLYAGSSNRWIIEYNPAVSANLQIGYNSTYVVSSFTPALNTWYRARLTRTPTGATLHVNGVLVATQTASPALYGLQPYVQQSTGAGTPLSPRLLLDYVAWETPVTRA